MHYVPGGLSFPRMRVCQCCSTPFLAQQMRDLHCSPSCQQAWKERLQVLQRLPAFYLPRKAQEMPTG